LIVPTPIDLNDSLNNLINFIKIRFTPLQPYEFCSVRKVQIMKMYFFCDSRAINWGTAGSINWISRSNSVCWIYQPRILSFYLVTGGAREPEASSTRTYS